MTLNTLNPAADDTDGNWLDDSGSATNLYASILDAGDDAEYIESADAPSTDRCKVELGTHSGTPTNLTHTIRVRARKDAAGDEINATFRLVEGASTVIATFDVDDISTTWTEHTHTLSGGEISAITDYDDLYLEFEADTVAAASLTVGDSAETDPTGNGSTISCNTPTHTASDWLLNILAGEEGWMTGSAPTNWGANGQVEAYSGSGRTEGKVYDYDCTTHGVAGSTVSFSSVLTNSKERASIMLAIEGSTQNIGASTLNVDNSSFSTTSKTSPTVSGTSGRLLVHVWIVTGTDAITAPAGLDGSLNLTGNTVSMLVGWELLSTTGTTTGRTITIGTNRSIGTAVFEVY